MAVLVFSIGLIGLAGLMVMSARSSHAAYLRTQVTFLATNMANRMSANSLGVWKGNYNSAKYPVRARDPGCGFGAACNGAALAQHDQAVWSSQLTTFLPDPAAVIRCTGVDAASFSPAQQLDLRPPYGGSCSMSISWSEQGIGDHNHRGNVSQTFAWEFQP